MTHTPTCARTHTHTHARVHTQQLECFVMHACVSWWTWWASVWSVCFNWRKVCLLSWCNRKHDGHVSQRYRFESRWGNGHSFPSCRQLYLLSFSEKKNIHTHTQTHTHTHTHFRGTGSNPVEGKGSFVTHAVSSTFRLSLSPPPPLSLSLSHTHHTHTHPHTHTHTKCSTILAVISEYSTVSVLFILTSLWSSFLSVLALGPTVNLRVYSCLDLGRLQHV